MTHYLVHVRDFNRVILLLKVKLMILLLKKQTIASLISSL